MKVTLSPGWIVTVCGENTRPALPPTLTMTVAARAQGASASSANDPIRIPRICALSAPQPRMCVIAVKKSTLRECVEQPAQHSGKIAAAGAQHRIEQAAGRAALLLHLLHFLRE